MSATMLATESLALASVPSHAPADKKTTQHKCEQELAIVIGRIRVDILEAGRLLTKLNRLHPHGTWMEYSTTLYKRLGISRSTGQRYIEAYEVVQDLGQKVVTAAEVADLNLNCKPVRTQLLLTKSQHPDASPDELVNLTNLALAQGRPENNCKPTDFPLSDINAEISELRLKLTQLKPASTEPQIPALVRNLKVLAREAVQLAQRLETL